MYHLLEYTTYTYKSFNSVTGDGEIRMPVLIKQHGIIHHLEGQTLDTVLKLTITAYQVKDNLV